jgi:hypothetical protein
VKLGTAAAIEKGNVIIPMVNDFLDVKSQKQ